MQQEDLLKDFPDKKIVKRKIKEQGLPTFAYIAFCRATYPIIKKGAPSMVYKHVDSFKKGNVWRIQILQTVPSICEIDKYLSYHYQNATNLISLMAELNGQKGVTLDSRGIIYTFELTI